MKAYKEYIIPACLILALGLYLFLYNPDKTNYKLPVLDAVTKSQISKLDVKTPDASFAIKKKGSDWYIVPQGYIADTDKVDSMLNDIDKLTLTVLVSEAQDYPRYNLGDDKKITVKAFSDDTVKRDFEIGKPASSYQHTFIKLTDDGRVYHARGNFRKNFNLTIDELRDKKVFSFDKSEIHQIDIIKEKKTITLEKKEISANLNAEEKDSEQIQPEHIQSGKKQAVWQNEDGKRCDEKKIEKFLNTMSNLKCDKYINDRKKDDFKNPVYTVVLKGTDEYKLSIFAKEDGKTGKRPVITSENNYPFYLTDYFEKKIMIKPDEIVGTTEKSKDS